MDKYEFNIKVDQIKKLVGKNDYVTAMKIADTIDWRRVRNANLLSMIATVYEKNEEFQEAKDILLLAFERAPIGKRLLYKLTELAVKEKNLREAEDYYREFCDLAQDDPRQHLLRYMILKEKGAPADQLIHTLEQYCNSDLDEKWLYELAVLYSLAGRSDLCVKTCDKIMLMFGLGKYVDKAMELKIQFAPLTKYQMDLVENRDKYEARLKAVEQGYEPSQPSGIDGAAATERVSAKAGGYGRQRVAKDSYGYGPYNDGYERDAEPETSYGRQEYDGGAQEAAYSGDGMGLGYGQEPERTYGQREADYSRMAERGAYGAADNGMDYGGEPEAEGYDRRDEEAGYTRMPSEELYGRRETERGYARPLPGGDAYGRRVPERGYARPTSEDAYSRRTSGYIRPSMNEDTYGRMEEEPGYVRPSMEEDTYVREEIESGYARPKVVDGVYGRREADPGYARPSAADAAYGQGEADPGYVRPSEKDTFYRRGQEFDYGPVTVEEDTFGRRKPEPDYTQMPEREAYVRGKAEQTRVDLSKETQVPRANSPENRPYNQREAAGISAGATERPSNPAEDRLTGYGPVGGGTLEIHSDVDENLVARLHEAEVKENLAREMSKISVDNEVKDEPELEHTRVLTDIKRRRVAAKPQPRPQSQRSSETRPPAAVGGEPAGRKAIDYAKPSNHLMIEAADRDSGLAAALDALKKLHKETGAKKPVVKVSGEKLNNKGILALSDKLTGKDLIIEGAGKMNEAILHELDQLMGRDETGMVVVMIDAPQRMEQLHGQYPGLAKRFERRSAQKKPSQQKPAEGYEKKTEVKSEPAPPKKEAVRHEEARPAETRGDEEPQQVQQEKPKPVSDAGERSIKEIPQPKAEPEEEMDIDEFAQYASEYAKEIDCSIPGKSMLALYERVEIMEEEGVSLTKEHAEELIEEAADKAERPPFGKRLKGLFSSKYDKDGLLILKEEHFI